MNTAWEYSVRFYGKLSIGDTLTIAGMYGYELVAIDFALGLLVFKRPTTEDALTD